jgi:methyl-accepting chemotaxis protein
MPDVSKYRRKKYIINRKLQFHYLFVILFTMLIAVFSVYFTAFYVVWNSVIDAFFFIPEASRKLADIFTHTSELIVIPVILLAVVFSIAGIFLSHRVAGPLYRVEKAAGEIAKGNLDVKVRFRKGDELQELAGSLNNMIDGIKGIVKEDKEITERLLKISDKLQNGLYTDSGLKKEVKGSINELAAIVKELKGTTDKFKI